MAKTTKAPETAIRVRGDLKQKDVRNLELEAVRVPINHLVNPKSSSFREVMLKAAIAAGWIEDPECKTTERMEGKERVVEYWFDGELVDDMDPKACYAAGEVIVNLMAEYTTLDPNSSTPPPTSGSDEAS